ncbi:hypothetical protein [Bradyrhizobium sp. NP1]|uniref:hypothetical protein n=1 Tax=Bradyrhizobium sp. NP1 TaxID=3049772 RepID=UPI0025A54057|nr:hypothetical protein [Bradyrhizobium sp. NP1]WJR76501.1 hypothetical protein QOU61_27610 [Bradyrhizobium sp. NP1]
MDGKDGGKPITPLNKDVLSKIQAFGPLIAAAADAAGVSPLAIAGAIAREMNKDASGDYNILHSKVLADALHGVANVEALYGTLYAGIDGAPARPLTNQDYVDNLNDVQRKGLANTLGAGIGGLFNRFNNTTLNDLGVAHIQVGTAMQALAYYLAHPQLFGQGSDPLGLGQYAGDTPKLVADLINPATSMKASIGLQAIIARQAYNWAAGRIADWNQMSDADKAAFVTAYSTLGQKFFDDRYNDYVNGGGRPGTLKFEGENTTGSNYLNVVPAPPKDANVPKSEGPVVPNGSVLQQHLTPGAGDIVDPTLRAPNNIRGPMQLGAPSGQVQPTAYQPRDGLFGPLLAARDAGLSFSGSRDWANLNPSPSVASGLFASTSSAPASPFGAGQFAPNAAPASRPADDAHAFAVPPNEATPADTAADPSRMRFLGTRIAGKPGVTLFDPMTQTMRFISSDSSDRVGNGIASPPISAPIDPNQPPQSTRRLGFFTGQPMPATRLPPSVFGLSDDSGTPDRGVEEFLARWIKPLLQQ